MQLIWLYEDLEKLALGAVFVCNGLLLLHIRRRERQRKEFLTCLFWGIGYCLSQQGSMPEPSDAKEADPGEFELARELSGEIKRVLEEAAGHGHGQSEIIERLRGVMTEDVCWRLRDPGLRGQLEQWIRYKAEQLCHIKLDIITLRNLWVYDGPDKENAGRSPAEGSFFIG